MTPRLRNGRRVFLRLGFDWLLAHRHSFSGTYLYQNDEAEVGELQQIGGFEGSEESQDNEAEFDLFKHKATILYSVTLSRRWVVSTYSEFIIKNFDDETDSEPTTAGRNDALFLSSTYLRYKVSQKYALKFRYLFRMNEVVQLGDRLQEPHRVRRSRCEVLMSPLLDDSLQPQIRGYGRKRRW